MDNIMTNLEQTRKERRKQTAEDFTPLPLVNEMLDKLPQEVWELEKLWVDPAAGNGNFLIEILRRKLLKGQHPLASLQTIYGIELMADNVQEMKERLLTLIPENLHNEAIKILNKNIICHNALTWDFMNWKSTEIKIKKLF